MSGFALSSQAHAFISRNFIPGATILELGSGEGSALLAERYDLHSVEHDPEWLQKFEKVRYIHAPIRAHKAVKGFPHERWYDKTVIAATQTIPYSLVIVDGPPAHVGRTGFLKYLSLFNEVPILFDDLHRTWEMKLAKKVAARRKCPLVVYGLDTFKHFGVIWPNRSLW